MFSNNNNKKPAQKVDEIDTVVGPGTKFEGNINATGIVRVDGVFSGEINTQGDIIVGEQGEVSGNLSSNNMIIAGVSNAKLVCNGKLEIRSSAKVIGDVEIDSIIIEDKAVFNGQCKMKKEVEASTKAVNKNENKQKKQENK